MSTSLFHDHLPYCLKKIKRDWYVLLNRSYQPIGMTANGPIDYKTHSFRLTKLTPKKAAKLSARRSEDRLCIYLYNDGCSPNSSKRAASDYGKRIALLAALRCEDRAAALG